MIAHLAWRVVLILLGYGLATLASGLVVGLIFAVVERTVAAEIPLVIMIAAYMIGIFAALPALFTVIAGEVMNIRHKVYYMVAATLIGMALPLFVELANGYIAVGLGFGPAAGLIYWRIAGRKAGFKPAV